MIGSRTRWLAVAAAAVLVATLAPASIAGAAAGGIVTGHVTDNGTPLANVQVRFQNLGGPTSVPLTTTDSAGAFTLSAVPPATYRVTYTLPGGAVFYANGATSFSDADPVTVADGATVTLEEAVPARGTIHGQLLKADGTTQPTAQVQLLPTSIGSSLSTVTDSAGNYSFGYVWPGTYKLSFRTPTGLTQYAHQKTTFIDADTIAVAAGDALTVDETMLATGNITGRLTNQGAPVSFAQVSVQNPDGSFVAFGSTAFDGSYRLVVPVGTYVVQFRLSSGIVQYAHQQTSLAAADRFTVTANQDTVVNEEVITPSTVRGTLLRADGTPASSIQVVVSSSDGRVHTAFTNPFGTWQVQVLPGTYSVRFFIAGLGTQWAFGKTTPDTADPIVAGPGETVVVDDRILAPGTLSVTARDKRTGEAILSFCVSTSTVGRTCTTTGTVAITTLPGHYDATVSTSDQVYLSQRLQGELAAGQTTSVVVDLVKASTLTTVIKDAETGVPVAHACVDLVKPFEPYRLGIGGTCSGADGVVTIHGLPAEIVNAFVDIRDGVHGMQWVGLNKGVGAQARARLIVIDEGATVTLPEIRLDKAGSITGVVRNGAGQPLANTYVAVSSNIAGYGPSGVFTVTDAQGRYTIDNLGPYAWPLFYKPLGSSNAAVFSGGTGDRFLARGIRVTAGQAATFDQAVRPGTILTGTVTNAQGGPVADFNRITLIHALSGDELGNSDITGTGPYALNVAGPLLVRLKIGEEWVGGADFFHATVFLVAPSGTTTANIVSAT